MEGEYDNDTDTLSYEGIIVQIKGSYYIGKMVDDDIEELHIVQIDGIEGYAGKFVKITIQGQEGDAPNIS